MVAESPTESVTLRGPVTPPLDIDVATQYLGFVANAWKDIQQSRISAQQRGLDDLAEALKKVEDKAARDVKKALMKHPTWGFLKDLPGLGGCYTAILISRIRDPRRFPGQRCSAGWHTLPAIYEVGTPCPMTDTEGTFCDGTMTDPRPGTGTRSIWHYCGLHAVDGRSPRKARGVRCDWDPRARTAVLQPGGIAEQIVRLKVEPYRTERYEATKERLQRERGVEQRNADEVSPGPALQSSGKVDIEGAGGNSAGLPGTSVAEEAEVHTESESSRGSLRPFQIDAIARKVAAKAFVADLLAYWKSVA